MINRELLDRVSMRCGQENPGAPRRKVIDKKSSGCCWRKLLGKAFNKKECQGSPHANQQDEIVYLNLYLSSLEKKMQAIEEVTRLKWYRKEMDAKTKADGCPYIKNGLRFLTEGSGKPYLPTPEKFIDGAFNQIMPSSGQYVARNPTLLRNENSRTIIREIMSLGSNKFNYESRKWHALMSPPIITEQDSVTESVIGTEMNQWNSRCVVETYYVGAISYPVEKYVVRNMAQLTLQNPKAPIKASCRINYFDEDNKKIEIIYDNMEWDKRGTIVLKDIENQAGVQAELVGRVVCFLLGMGDAESLQNS